MVHIKQVKTLVKMAILSALMVVSAICSVAHSSPIYRCGNEYTNAPTPAQKSSCQAISNSNVSILEIPAPKSVKKQIENNAQQSSRRVKSTSESGGASSANQKTKDQEARQILDAEMKREQSKLDELQKEYNDGAPEKIGPEHKNYQKYLDRTAQMKADIERVQSNIAALKREIARHGGLANDSGLK